MPRILVADDNSNIQKMVGLALKDQGIDVVAVGNGEAAVRKISDIKPDLVLADVFMPVRNGYEVCKYVKDDAALKHIPVILLVGAFDPLDEQEAQRVGADGVLKKPFVPPDPLISMVKSALARAGVAHPAAAPAADKTTQPGALKTSDLLPKAVPMIPSVPAFEPPQPFVPVLEDQGFVDEVHTGPAPVKIDAGSQPLAFGSLLDAPETKEPDDMDFVPPSNAGLVPERTWQSAEEEDTEETIDEPQGAWRRDAADEAFESAAPTRAVADWRDTAIGNAPPSASSHGGWQPSKEKSPLTEAAETPARSNGVAAEIRASTNGEIGAIPSTSSPTADAWAKAIALAQEEKPIGAFPEIATKSAVEAPAESATAEKSSSGGTWYSAPPSPWDKVAEKATQLASTWDAPVATPPAGAENAEAGPELITETTEPSSDAYSTESLLLREIEEPEPEPTDIQQEELAPLIPELPRVGAAVQENPAQAEAFVPETAATSATQAVAKVVTKEMKEAAAKSESQDELVAKVLAKMSPEMLQAVTREILKPVVEAMVKEQLESKK